MAFRLGLKGKFFLYSNVLIVVTMAAVTGLWIGSERSNQLEAIERRGRSIVEVMAIPVTDALMYEEIGLTSELGLIEDLIAEVRAGNQDLVRYVAVINPAGIVTHSDRWNLLGRALPDGEPWPAAFDGIARRLIEAADGEPVLEMKTRLGISSRTWGTMVVGFGTSSVRERITEVTRFALVVALVMVVLNSTVTAIYVQWLFRPVIQLNETMKRAANEDLDVRASERRGDEVGELACSFNQMMDQLSAARDRDHMRRAQLIHTEKMVATGTLAAGVAHEVNNPLAGILGCLENMRNNPDDDAMAERYLELIKNGLERIQRTVTNLLDFSRPREMTLEPTSLNHSLQHVLELMAYQLKQSAVRVELDLTEADEVEILADHFQMEQMFLNLMLNALRAMPEGGTLHLRTTRRRGTVSAEVRDTGFGIPEKNRNLIFNPFFTTRQVGEGTGLGLTVVASIVAAHAGEIAVESEEGRGSAFRVSFKAA